MSLINQMMASKALHDKCCVVEWPWNRPGLQFATINNKFLIYNKKESYELITKKQMVVIKFEREIHRGMVLFKGELKSCNSYVDYILIRVFNLYFLSNHPKNINLT